jgi:uncharacterized linocin/CFP29 family protein
MFTKTKQTMSECTEDIFCGVNTVADLENATDLEKKHLPFLFRRYPQGNATELEHLKQMVTDGIVKAPAVRAGGIFLCTCGPFANIVLGQDLTTGFIGPAGSEYEFLVSESIALWLTQPAAVCILK